MVEVESIVDKNVDPDSDSVPGEDLEFQDVVFESF